jgi:hypothetical protein
LPRSGGDDDDDDDHNQDDHDDHDAADDEFDDEDTMTRKELSSFKISDQVKAPVERPKAKKEKDAGPPPSVGFPRIEAVVESGDAQTIAGLQARLAALQEMAKAGSNKDKLAAKKAAAAYEKTKALLDYLLATKAKLTGG